MTRQIPIGEFLAELHRRTICHRAPDPAATGADRALEHQRRLIAEHDRRSGRSAERPPQPDVVRRSASEKDRLLRARREAVLATLQHDPATPPTQLRDQLGAPLTTILRDIEALRLGGLIPMKEDRT
ncbi:hypothetical protein [Mangrovicoccus algicola]|uniref:Uncharacterized protein n=1 Tax=Mangrovicoccus algicola TaxID=2771008 RepID=A0A8J6YQ60_9RHOB|nr:hypothetical protein [Mangrovicoccus algicola]MBE3637488.1 hypothetical protein [Mangrovicoccus algicola]